MQRIGSGSSPKGELTTDRFEGLLLRLDLDRDRAGEKYEEIRWKLIKFFQWGSCLDAEDLVDETFNRVAERLGSNEKDEINDVVGFAWGVAKKIRQEAIRLHSKTIHLSGLPRTDHGFAYSRVADAGHDKLTPAESRLSCLRSCIQQLPVDDG